MYGGRGTRGTLKDFWRYDIGEMDACLLIQCDISSDFVISGTFIL